MSDNVPFKIQVEIIKRLPVKSLIQIRFVCKAWKSVIDSPDFIRNYSDQVQHLLVRYNDRVDFQTKYVLIADDDRFPHQKVSLTIPPSLNALDNRSTISCSHRLLCLYDDYQEGRDGPVSGTGKAILWNPSIRKTVVVDVPNVADSVLYETVLRFGFCRETSDLKTVKIIHVNMWGHRERVSSIPWQFEVFTIRTGAWRRHYSSTLPRKSIHFHQHNMVVVDGVLYCLANDMDGRLESCNLIISFDMTSEEFTQVKLPAYLTHQCIRYLSIDKMRESLVVLEHDVRAGVNDLVFCVWMMEVVVTKSFTKIFTIIIPDNVYLAYVAGFRQTGEPIIDSEERYPEWTGSLAVYEPYSKSISSLGINGKYFSYVENSYIETLFLV